MREGEENNWKRKQKLKIIMNILAHILTFC